MLLNVKELGIALGTPAHDVFNGVSFALGGGETALATGTSGAGKTTLGMAIAGLLPEWAGEYTINGGIEFDGGPVVQGQPYPGTSVVMENPYSQLSGLKSTVAGELAFPLECRGIPRGEIVSAIEKTAHMLGIGHLLDRKVRTLSGGELQRLLIATALVAQPRLLFLDRPFTEIDEDSREGILKTIRDHVRTVHGVAIIAEDPWLVKAESFYTVIQLGSDENPDIDEVFSPSEPSGEPHRFRMTPSAHLVRVEDLRFAYPGGEEILGGISFSLGRGDIAFITGPNGAGKSTLAKLLAGLLKPSSGDIHLDGRSYGGMNADGIASRVGLTFQNAALHLSRGTVREEFALAERWGRPAWRWAGVFGLDRVFGSHPLELTRAGVKRLATALAAGGNPDMIILDEPSQYQDGEGFRMLAEGIGLIAAGGTTVLVITHDPRLNAAFPTAVRIPVGGFPQGGMS